LDPQEDTPTPMERGVRRNQRLDMQRGHATNRARPAGDVLSETVTTQPAPQGLEASALALQRLAGHGPNIDIGTDPLAQMHAANARSRRRRALQRIAENRVALSLDTSIHPTPSAATSRPVQSPSMAATELAHQNTPGATMHSGPTGPDDTMARRRDASRMLVTSLTEWARQFDSRESLQAAISSIRDLSPSSKIEIEYLLELRQSGQASEAPLQPQVTATTESTVQGGATVTTSSGPMDTVGQQVPPDQDTQLVQQQRSLFYSRATTTRPESVRTPSPQTAPQGGLSSGHEAQAYAENEKGWVRNATEGTIQDEELTRDIVQTMLAMRSDPETLTEFMALLPPPTGTGPHYSAQGPTAEPSTPTAGQALLAGIHQASGAKTTEQPRQKKSKRVTGSFSPEWTVHE
jgi:hypothetical protein